MKVRHIGFVTGKEFVGGLLEEAMQIEPVYGVIGYIHSCRIRVMPKRGVN
jgi:hypothetical protein